MTHEALIAGIDVGTGGVRTLVVDLVGNVIAHATAEHPLLLPRPGWTEQHPSDWWAGAMSTLRQVTGELGVRRHQIIAVGLTGQMHGSVFLDRHGAVVRPALLWNDQRTVAECDEITQRVGANELLRVVGNPAITGFTAPKILWLRNHEPEAFSRVAKVILPKDYVRYRLTGALTTDMADGSGTLLVDIAGRRWADSVLAALDLPRSLMPDLCEGTDVTGFITTEAAGLTGLPAGIPVMGGGGDQAAGAAGLGLVDEGRVSCQVGTSGVVFAATNRPAMHPQGKLHAFCHAVPGRWHLMGVMLSAGGALRWFRDTLCNGLDYDGITAEAEHVPPGAEGLVFLPYLTGERTPHMDPFARGAFIGLGLHHTRAHMARAVLEGISLGLTDSMDMIRALGISVPEVRLTGGGARSELWRGLLAACFRAKVVRMQVDEGPAFGSAILAATGAGQFPSVADACDAMVNTADTSTPNGALSEAYKPVQALYREAYYANQSLFRKQGGV